MTVSKAHIKATAKYNLNNYEEIKIRVKKGEKATLQAIAQEQGQSLNSFIASALEYYIQHIKSTKE